jgi:UDP-2,3-diacylglucosamine pyrophosphatase LpxH
MDAPLPLVESIARGGAPADIFSATTGLRRSTKSPDRARLHRAIFISDCHLGTRGCKAELLADFLAHNDCRTLYLVGDILDGIQPPGSWYWDEAHTRVIEEIVFKAQTGTRVVYIPGNHDHMLRAYCGLTLAGVQLQRDAVHQTARGTRLLVLHGDEFDGILRQPKWLVLLGGVAYGAVLVVHEVVHEFRRRMALPYWPLAGELKNRLKSAAQYIADFESAAASAAGAAGAEGVVCGHIHQPVTRSVNGVIYGNCGDWVENCTALVEDGIGTLRLIRWAGAEATTSAEPCDASGVVAAAA